MVSCSSRWTQIHCVAEDDLDLLVPLLHSQVLGLQACAIFISLSAYWKTDISAHKMWLMLTNSRWWTSKMKKQGNLKEVKEVITKTYLRSWLYYHKIKMYGSMILISYMKEAEKKKRNSHIFQTFIKLHRIHGLQSYTKLELWWKCLKMSLETLSSVWTDENRLQTSTCNDKLSWTDIFFLKDNGHQEYRPRSPKQLPPPRPVIFKICAWP